MSTTTELLLFQAASAPAGASALGIPASEADYQAFAETLKTELGHGQSGTKTGNSLPQKGESVPNGAASVAREKDPASGSRTGLGASQSQVATRDGGVNDPGNAQLDAGDGALHVNSGPDYVGGSALGDSSSDTAGISADAFARQGASTLPPNWTAAELSDRLAAIDQMFAGVGIGAATGGIDSEVHQLLAQSSLSLDAIEQRLAQLAQAGIFEGFQPDDVRAAALIQRVAAQFEELAMSGSTAKTAIDSQTVTVGLAARPDILDTAQLTRHATAAASKAAASPELNFVVTSTSNASARLDAISNMLASSGQGVISGTISADLHQMLANSDEGLDVIQARLQALAKEGIVLFDKETYLASPRISGSGLTAEHLSSSAAVRSLVDQALADPVRAGQAVAKSENAQRSGLNASNATAVNAPQLGNVRGLQGIEIDTRRGLTNSQSQQAAVKPDAASVDASLRASNPMADEVRQALVAVRQGDAAGAARESASSSLSDRSTAVTLSPAQMAAQRRAVAPPSVGDARSMPDVDAVSTTRATLTASGGPESSGSVGAERMRMAASMNSQTVATATTANLDAVRLAEGQGAIQDARMDARLSQDLSVNRSMSFELPSSSQPTVASTGSAAAPGVAAAIPSSTTASFRTTAEAPMQNAPWSPQFSEELGERVRVFVNNGLQEARLQLTPADLGRVQITINTEGDHARVVFVAETAVARDLLDQSMPRLREMLQQSGIQLAQGDVSDQAESQARGEQLQADADSGARNDADGQAAEAEHASINVDKPAEGQEGRVDTYI